MFVSSKAPAIAALDSQTGKTEWRRVLTKGILSFDVDLPYIFERSKPAALKKKKE